VSGARCDLAFSYSSSLRGVMSKVTRNVMKRSRCAARSMLMLAVAVFVAIVVVLPTIAAPAAEAQEYVRQVSISYTLKDGFGLTQPVADSPSLVRLRVIRLKPTRK
jgi:hypothetical protein